MALALFAASGEFCKHSRKFVAIPYRLAAIDRTESVVLKGC